MNFTLMLGLENWFRIRRFLCIYFIFEEQGELLTQSLYSMVEHCAVRQSISIPHYFSLLARYDVIVI
jgi:hypothetical protein